MDRVEVLQCCKRSWKQNQMEGEGCYVCGAPTVIDYGIGAGAGAGKVAQIVEHFTCFAKKK